MAGSETLTKEEVKKSDEAPPRLLVIDDEKGIRDVLEYDFTARGWTVFCAADVAEAVEQGRIRKPDVAICDLMLPGGNGAQVLEALKKMDSKMEVIIITGNATLESAIACLRRGAYDYLTKPFKLEDVARLVVRALENRRLSRQLVHMTELNRLKTEFIAGMSHELRTPLNAVIGYVSLILDQAYGPVVDKQKQALSRVDVNARNLLQLINNILDVSKVGAGHMELYEEDFVLEDLLKEVGESLMAIAESKSLALTWRAPAGLKLRTDRMKLKQGLVNLVGNALKFTKKGGVDISADAVDDRVKLRVKDTGVGIRTEDIPLLFQEYKQADIAETRHIGGTGLGLTITRKLIGLMGGSISVQSEHGQGSTFTITLPLRPAAKPVEGGAS